MPASRPLSLTVLPYELAICRLPPDTRLPAWMDGLPFYSLTRAEEELSIVCPVDAIPPDIQAASIVERGWRALKVAGPLDFSLTGVLASLAGPLAGAGISIFAISTFDTDYLLVRSETLEKAIQVLEESGHTVIR